MYMGNRLPVSALEENPDLPGTGWFFELDEASSGDFQTGWTPTLSVTNPSTVDGSPASVRDGAGPVIARVIHYPGAARSGGTAATATAGSWEAAATLRWSPPPTPTATARWRR